MFNLSGAASYKYIPNYKDMRGGYDKLCGVVRTLGQDPEDGTAYVFTSKDRKLVKIIRHEHNECQLYIQRFDNHMSFVRLTFEGTRPVYVLDWKYICSSNISDNGRTYRHRTYDNASQLRVVFDTPVCF